MKKSLFIGLLVGTMCLGLVGCGGFNGNGSISDSGVSTESGSKDPKISTMLPNIDNTFSDADVSIVFDRSDRYTANVVPASQDDYKTYNVKVNVNGVFTDCEKYVCADDGGSVQYLDANEKYELDISWDAKDNGSMSIRCYTTSKNRKFHIYGQPF